VFLLFVLWLADPTDGTLRKAIEAQHATQVRALVDGDAAGYAATFTEDARVLRPNAPMTDGRASILSEQEATLSRADVVSGAIQTVDLSRSGDMVYEIGNFSYTYKLDGGPSQTVGGKFLAIWRLQSDGRWLCEVDAGLPE